MKKKDNIIEDFINHVSKNNYEFTDNTTICKLLNCDRIINMKKKNILKDTCTTNQFCSIHNLSINKYTYNISPNLIIHFIVHFFKHYTIFKNVIKNSNSLFLLYYWKWITHMIHKCSDYVNTVFINYNLAKGIYKEFYKYSLKNRKGNNKCYSIKGEEKKKKKK